MIVLDVSCLNIFKTGTVQRRRFETYNDPSYVNSLHLFQTLSFYLSVFSCAYATPRVHAVVFEPGVGRLKKLHVNYQDLIEECADIYDMYGLRDIMEARRSKNNTPVAGDSANGVATSDNAAGSSN